MTPRTSIAAVLCALALWSVDAHAGDYERNDVSGREVALVGGRVPANDGPFGVTFRGVARRHTRFFYLAAELETGVTFRPGAYVAFGGAVGVETADNAYTRIRGYGQVGVAGQWSHTSPYEALVFHVELGARVQLQTNVRPHSYAFVGTRVNSNFKQYGVSLAAGVGWTFD